MKIPSKLFLFLAFAACSCSPLNKENKLKNNIEVNLYYFDGHVKVMKNDEVMIDKYLSYHDGDPNGYNMTTKFSFKPSDRISVLYYGIKKTNILNLEDKYVTIGNYKQGVSIEKYDEAPIID